MLNRSVIALIACAALVTVQAHTEAGCRDSNAVLNTFPFEKETLRKCYEHCLTTAGDFAWGGKTSSQVLVKCLKADPVAKQVYESQRDQINSALFERQKQRVNTRSEVEQMGAQKTLESVGNTDANAALALVKDTESRKKGAGPGKLDMGQFKHFEDIASPSEPSATQPRASSKSLTPQPLPGPSHAAPQPNLALRPPRPLLGAGQPSSQQPMGVSGSSTSSSNKKPLVSKGLDEKQ